MNDNDTLREQAEKECLRILEEPFFSACGYLPDQLKEAMVKLFLNKEDSEIIRKAYKTFYKQEWV
jgi:hypothetical protein